MAQLDRLTRIANHLTSGRCLGRQQLLDEFEISAATLKRDLTLLRDRLNAPIVWDRERGGYRLELSQPSFGPQYELPGLWLSARVRLAKIIRVGELSDVLRTVCSDTMGARPC